MGLPRFRADPSGGSTLGGPMPRTPSDRTLSGSDPASLAAAYESLAARVSAPHPEAAPALPPDTRGPLAVVLQVAELLKDDALRARFERLPREEFDAANAGELLGLARAFQHAHAEAEAAASAVEVTLPEALAQRAHELRARMVKVVVHYFEDDPDLAADVKVLGRRRPHPQLAADLARLAEIYEARNDVVSLDPKYYKATDAADARAIAAEVRALVEAARGEAEKQWRARAERLWAMVTGAYDEVRAAGRFLLRKAGGDERFPTLPGARKARASRAKPEGEGDARG